MRKLYSPVKNDDHRKMPHNTFDTLCLRQVQQQHHRRQIDEKEERRGTEEDF